ncbi:hypothetical protein F8388_003554 [Cannabis sativa]|uniref:Myb/SANT-like domain-containing protein n=1 Tax=Cannabis sativa TaxID=3483 RepID=A0A7J6EMI0_CANSA|nr:hypothetical protein F8388_003554 [Cannabis sativa]
METSKGRGPGQNKRFWSEDEDKHLIESLMELNNEGKFKAEGNFKLGHLRAIEMKLKERMPGCDIQAKPHIESRIKTLKIHFQIVHEMLTGSFCSAFGWDSNKKTVTAEKPVWEAYLQVDAVSADLDTAQSDLAMASMTYSVIGRTTQIGEILKARVKCRV